MLEERATSKNDDRRTVLLRHDLHILLETRRKPEGRVFRLRQGGHLKDLLKRCTLAVCGLPPPPRWKKGEKRRLAPHRLIFVNFHDFGKARIYRQAIRFVPT